MSLFRLFGVSAAQTPVPFRIRAHALWAVSLALDMFNIVCPLCMAVPALTVQTTWPILQVLGSLLTVICFFEVRIQRSDRIANIYFSAGPSTIHEDLTYAFDARTLDRKIYQYPQCQKNAEINLFASSTVPTFPFTI